MSCVADLALWDRALSSGEADLAGLTERADFLDGQTNLYARGLVVGARRGVRTEDHGGLWPGYKTGFLRAPEIDATVICMINNGAGDAQALAMNTLDAILDGLPNIHPVPPMPSDEVLLPLAGLYVDAATPMTLEIAVSAGGMMTCNAFGVPQAVSAREDHTLISGRGPFALALQPREGGMIVTLPSGHVQEFVKLAAPSALPDGVDGSYESVDMASNLAITGSEATLSGPIMRGRGCSLSGIEGDVIRIHMPSVLFSGWLDARVLRSADGAVTGLMVHGGRAKGVLFTRVAG